MAWFQKSLPLTGSVFYRGSLPPRPEQVRLPEGATIDRRDAGPGEHWIVEAHHPTLGDATLTCLRDPMLVPRVLLDFDTNLTEVEREEAARARIGIGVTIQQTRGHLLGDRKRLLRWLGAIFDADGVLAFDHISTRAWSRAMLDDELSHDADVDVSALYAMHAVNAEGRMGADGTQSTWLHTHGLGELGKFDYDIVRPHESLLSNGADALRAIAFAVLEDKLKPGVANFRVFAPGGEVAAVEAKAFDAAAPADERAIRDIGPDDGGIHTTNRVVLCDPAGGWLTRLFGRTPVRASRALMNFPEERALIFFSNEATALAEARAQATYPRFAEFFEETRELGLPATVKIGYQIDDGGPNDREHLWFDVAKAGTTSVEATLMNQPFNIERLKEGDRGTHTLEGLSDWMLMTPVGTITPRSFGPMRIIRERPEVREKLREWHATQSAKA